MASIIEYAGSDNKSLHWCVTDIIGKGVASLPPPTLPVPNGGGNGNNENGNGGGSGNGEGNTTGLNNHPSVSNTPLLKKAVVDQSQYVFKTFGETTGLCAQYSYNIAYKVKQHIETNSSVPIPHPKVSSGGNADQDAHRQAIKKLGLYDEYYVGEFTGTQLKSPSGPIKSRSWNYGDILNYYAPCCSGTSYMHTQIYTGDIWEKGINGRGAKNATRNSGWSTSGKTNYGTYFVYSGDNKVYKIYAYKVKAQYLK